MPRTRRSPRDAERIPRETAPIAQRRDRACPATEAAARAPATRASAGRSTSRRRARSLLRCGLLLHLLFLLLHVLFLLLHALARLEVEPPGQHDERVARGRAGAAIAVIVAAGL